MNGLHMTRGKKEENDNNKAEEKKNLSVAISRKRMNSKSEETQRFNQPTTIWIAFYPRSVLQTDAAQGSACGKRASKVRTKRAAGKKRHNTIKSTTIFPCLHIPWCRCVSSSEKCRRVGKPSVAGHRVVSLVIHDLHPAETRSEKEKPGESIVASPWRDLCINQTPTSPKSKRKRKKKSRSSSDRISPNGLCRLGQSRRPTRQAANREIVKGGQASAKNISW